MYNISLYFINLDNESIFLFADESNNNIVLVLLEKNKKEHRMISKVRDNLKFITLDQTAFCHKFWESFCLLFSWIELPTK